MKKTVTLILVIRALFGMSQTNCLRLFTATLNYNNPNYTSDVYTNFNFTQAYQVFNRTNEPVSTVCSTATNPHPNIKKPFIICEGYDIFALEDPSQVYYHYLHYKDVDGYNRNLGDDLRNAGYDVIVINLNTPQAILQPQGIWIAEFIKYINSIKIGQEANVLMGISEGGVLCRYALNYLESQYIDHKTKMFISFDAPQKGAVSPLSLQWLTFNIGFVSPVVPEIATLYTALASTGSKQLLIDYYNNTNSSTYQSAPNAYHTLFQDEIDNMVYLGYPKKCENIAISMGSYKGTKQTMNDGTRAVSGVNGFRYALCTGCLPWWLGGACTYVAYTDLKLDPGYDNSALNGLTTCMLRYQGNGCHGSLKNNRQSRDIAPGAYTGWFGIMKDGFNKIGGCHRFDSYIDSSNFIPTNSALALNVDNLYVNLASYGKNDVVSSSAFDDIWWDANQDNRAHAEMKQEGIAPWTYNKISSTPYGSYRYRSQDDKDITISNVNLTNNSYLITNSQNILLQNVTSSNSNMEIVSSKDIIIEGESSFEGETSMYIASVLDVKNSNNVSILPNASLRMEENGQVLESQFADVTDVLNLYPNPTSQQASMIIKLSESAEVLCSLSDLVGNKIISFTGLRLTKGVHDFILETNTLKSGVYMCVAEINGIKHTKKLVVVK